MKQLISISFILLFMATISLPSIVLLIDDSVDVSMLFSITEEEETKELKSFQVVEKVEQVVVTSSFSKNITDYQFKTYVTPHLNLIFPPPEHA